VTVVAWVKWTGEKTGFVGGMWNEYQDGKNIKSYLNGKFEPRDPELIDHTIGFEGHPDGLVQSKNPYYFPNGMGNNGSDFTVGAVLLKAGMGNFFTGLIGGLAVFSRALSADEL
jgi:hypothetical protein